MTQRRPDRGLDALNLLVAAMGTAYGAFIPVYLTAQAWTQTSIGFALTLATITSTLCQIPAGMWVDAAGARRRHMARGAVLAIGIVPLILALAPKTTPVFFALALQAAAGTLLSPVITSISLTVAGREGFGEQLGRNARYGSIGAGIGAAVMGVSSAWISPIAVFLIATALLPLALLAVRRIGADTEVPEATSDPDQPGWVAPFTLLRDRRIVIFALALLLFQFASIAVLNLAAVDVTARAGARGGLFIAAYVIIPQAIVALLSPAIGAWASTHGRRPVLLASFAATPIRALAFAAIHNPYALMAVQTLEGSSGAAFGVMMPLVAADLTRGTRHYTLCLALLGLGSTLGAALSTVVAGFVADRFGRPAAFTALAAAGLAGTLLILFAFTETREKPVT